MKKMYTCLLLLLAYSGIKAQNTALEFDGNNDYGIITVKKPPGDIKLNDFTFEAIIRAIPNGGDMPILYSPHATSDIEFGITNDLNIYFRSGRDTYYSEETTVANNECQHVAVTVYDEDILFYINGTLVNTVTLVKSVTFPNKTNFTLGSAVPNHDRFYRGTIDEVRIWPTSRNATQIALFATATPDYTELPRYLLLPFWEATGSVTFDPVGTPDNYATWDTTSSTAPAWGEYCISDIANYVERLGSDPLPNCIPDNVRVFNLICNGNFEQYDSILDDPFNYITLNNIGALVLDVNNESDVVNWHQEYNWPKFYVRSSYGGIPKNNSSILAPNTWNWPTTGNNAMASISSSDVWPTPDWREVIATKLNSPLLPGEDYTFSGWFYTGCPYDTSVNASQDLKIEFFSSSNPAVSHQSVPTRTLTNYKGIATNDGWEHITINFTFPSLASSVLDELHISVLHNQSSYTIESLMDDLVLEPTCGTGFPIGVALDTSHNQVVQKFLGIDSLGNIYAAANSYLSSTQYGYILYKYDECGDTIWTIPVNYSSQALLSDMIVTEGGTIYLAQDFVNSGNSNIRVLNSSGTQIAVTSNLLYRINSMARRSNGLITFTIGSDLYELNLSNIVSIPTSMSGYFDEITLLSYSKTDSLYIAGRHFDGTYLNLNIAKAGPSDPFDVSHMNVIESPESNSHHQRMVVAIEFDSYDNVYIAGSFDQYLVVNSNTIYSGMGNWPSKGYILKFDKNLSSLYWLTQFNDPSNLVNYNVSTISDMIVTNNDDLIVTGNFDTLVYRGAFNSYNIKMNNGSSTGLETYVLGLDLNCDFRWFEHTKNSGANAWPFDNRNQTTIKFQESTGNYIVAGSFYQSNTEVFDHGTLNSSSDNNLFICRLVDYFSAAVFKKDPIVKISPENLNSLRVLYPNPSSSYFKIEMNELNKPLIVEIYNVQGSLLKTETVLSSQQEIDVTMLKNGVYLVKSADLDFNNQQHTRLIVNK